MGEPGGRAGAGLGEHPIDPLLGDRGLAAVEPRVGERPLGESGRADAEPLRGRHRPLAELDRAVDVAADVPAVRRGGRAPATPAATSSKPGIAITSSAHAITSARIERNEYSRSAATRRAHRSTRRARRTTRTRRGGCRTRRRAASRPAPRRDRRARRGRPLGQVEVPRRVAAGDGQPAPMRAARAWPNWRSGSSTRKRLAAASVSCTIDLSTSAASTRATDDASSDSSEQIVSTASRPNGPANTDTRPNRICSLPVEQVERPADQLGERLVALGATGLGVVEQVEALPQPLGERGRADGARASCGQLDGQREAVDAPHDLGDGRRVLRVEREVGVRSGGTLDEHPHGGHVRQLARRRRAGRHRERLDPTHVLARQPEHLPARRQHRQVGADREHALGEAGDGDADVLAVVEDEQRAAGRAGTRRATPRR